MGDVVGAAGGGAHSAILAGQVMGPPRASDGLETLPEARRASRSVKLFDEPDPPAGSSTLPTCDSSKSSSWVLRAIRRAKPAADRREEAAGNRHVEQVPPARYPRHRRKRRRPASVQRMFTTDHAGSSSVATTSACTTAAPPPRVAHDLGDPRHGVDVEPHLGQRRQMVVVGGEPG